MKAAVTAMNLLLGRQWKPPQEGRAAEVYISSRRASLHNLPGEKVFHSVDSPDI